jgi:D-alanyl-D-alanine dipeptidase
MNSDFVFVDEFAPGIRWDAKYATWDNFTGKPVDGYHANRIGLLLWDGYRPQRAVNCFLRWSQQPENGRTKRRHYPNIDRPEMFERGYVAARSGHSRGGTVDLTLYELATGDLAPMGGRHDLMDAVSHHGARGITSAEAENRHHLWSIMQDCGFNSYDREWWHYTLEYEPYPSTYFDFPIT